MATQNRILELLLQEEEAESRYVEASSFRRGQTAPSSTTSTTTERVREYFPEILSNENLRERDPAYERSLSIVVPSSFL